jgi:beta-xylosidase
MTAWFQWARQATGRSHFVGGARLLGWIQAQIGLLVLAPALQAAPPPPAPWVPDRGDGTYQNPVLHADYSDPDVVRVGDDFWLTASSFNQVPGLPVLHSRDLVNWELVNHALPRLDYLDANGRSLAEHYSIPRHGEGVWAPAIRYHAGRFMIYFPDPDYGIYVVTAADPRGRWSAPVLVEAGQGLIDPCPFWDDDGKAYLVHAWARSRSGKNNQLTLHELSPDGTRVVDGEGRVIIDENTAGHGFTTLEGPKLYRHGGAYWIFAPVGGVPTGSQAVYRATHIQGPYESRIVLAQGSTPINGPHQGAWVDTPTGENWFVHFQDKGAFGRVVHLEPMSWGPDGWPRLGTAVATDSACGEPVLTYAKPKMAAAEAAAARPRSRSRKTLPVRLLVPATSDEFDGPTLGLQWQWQANPRPDFYSFVGRSGRLRLNCLLLAPGVDLYVEPNLLLEKFPAPAFTATTRLTFAPTTVGDTAGLVVFGDDYAYVGVTRAPEATWIVFRTRRNEAVYRVLPEPRRPIQLRVKVSAEGQCTFAWSNTGPGFIPIGSPFTAQGAHWVGAKVGLFATRLTDSSSPAVQPPAVGHADFDYFRLTP